MMEQLSPIGHTATWGAIIAIVAGVLPPFIALCGAVLGVVFYLIKIYESRTIQHWLTNHKLKVQAKKLSKLKAQALVTTAKIAAIETARVARVEARELVADATVTAKQLLVTEATSAAKATL